MVVAVMVVTVTAVLIAANVTDSYGAEDTAPVSAGPESAGHASRGDGDKPPRWLPVSLRGMWQFAPDRFLDPTAPAPREDWTVLPVPGSWNQYLGEPGPNGIGTYRLVLDPEDYPQATAIMFPDQAIAYHCFVNGETVAVSGHPGATYGLTQVMRKTIVVPLPTNADRYEILCHIANHHYDVGGMINVPRLGDYQVLSILRDGKMLFTGIFAGALLVIAFYYLRLLQNTL